MFIFCIFKHVSLSPEKGICGWALPNVFDKQISNFLKSDIDQDKATNNSLKSDSIIKDQLLLFAL